jgi:hypothetical protein
MRLAPRQSAGVAASVSHAAGERPNGGANTIVTKRR